MDRDNHAGKIDSLSYIGGFFDGEGYIGLGMQRTHGGKDRNILPSVRMSNTDIRPLEFIHSELTKAGIKCWISSREGSRRNLKTKVGNYVKTIHDVGLSGKIQVKEFIRLIRPYVLVKGDQLDVMMDFIDSRDRRMAGRGGRKGIGKVEYSEEEIAYIDRLKILKH
jgi:hypothetical protein